ncbi:MAG: hypothetical protein QHG99_03260 [Methanomicrobiales archaeon]|nr:hypothetical protein [Methanomicrobiales archaeon]
MQFFRERSSGSRERVPEPATRLFLLMLLAALLGVSLYPILTAIDQRRDPDGDGLPSYQDPHPFEFDEELDSDGDGWTNGYERLIGTALWNADQDGDGLRDGGDEDGDGMSNWFERNIGGLNPQEKNERFYVQLISFPLPSSDEEWNRRYWLDYQGIGEDDLIVRYSVTYEEFIAVIHELEQSATDQSLIFFYLKTHGTGSDASEPSLCFANVTDPSRADICGEFITYRELDSLLDRIPCHRMMIAYSSCAGESALDILEEGRCPRVTLSLMGSTVGIPADHALQVAMRNPDGYFAVADLINLLEQSRGERGEGGFRDSHRIAGSFYFGDQYNRLLPSSDMG